MWVPDDLHTVAKASEKVLFYCAYGHPQHFPEGESVDVLLRRERDQLKQQLAQKDDQIRNQGVEIAKLQKVERELKQEKRKIVARTSKGVCPCCNRQFQNMASHMKTKHPDFRRELA